MMLSAGRGFAIEDGDQLAATALYLPYVPRLAWIGMVMTHPDFRRRGLATVLTEHCIREAETRGLTAALDATVAGEQVYQRLGFERVAEVSRMLRSANTHADGAKPLRASGAAAQRSIQQFGPSHAVADDVLALDAEVYGVDRSSILGDLIRRAPDLSLALMSESGRVLGYCLGRRGRQVRQVGPVVVRDEGDGSAAVDLVARNLGENGPVLIDVPDLHDSFRRRLESAGFERQRGYIRMVRPTGASFSHTSYLKRVFGIGGPAIG